MDSFRQSDFELAEETNELSSWNHSWVQLQLAKTLLTEVPEYVPNIELSLDIRHIDLSQFDMGAKEELKPDICLYPANRRGLSRPNDILRMTEMPVAAIEILSPKQGVYDLKEKFKAYFFLGIKSCWLVVPELEMVSVYSTIANFKTFSLRSQETEVIDEVLGIRLALAKIFN